MAEPVMVTQVTKTFQTRHESVSVLRDVHLEIASGEFLAVLGPSGCGKSTLLRLIAGLDRPSTGMVRLGDQTVTNVDARCAVMFQEPRLFPWKTLAANVAVGGHRIAEPRSADEMLRLVGLTGFAQSYPHQVSGGMAQRAALARALIGHPEVLLLDEPFAALDAFTRMQMQDLLAEACQALRPTVVMVTHDVDEALFLADRVVVMSQRPSTVAATLSVKLPRPRDRGDAALVELRAKILSLFGFSHAVSGDGADVYTI